MRSFSHCDSMNGFEVISHSSSNHVPPDHRAIPDYNVCLDDNEGNTVQGDYFNGVFDYLRRMLMEEDDLERRPCMFQDCSALQAAEKYFHDALSSTPSNGDVVVVADPDPDPDPDPQFGVNHNNSNQTLAAGEYGEQQNPYNNNNNNNTNSCNRAASGFAEWSVLDSSQFCSDSPWLDGYPTCNLYDVNSPPLVEPPGSTRFQVQNSTANQETTNNSHLQERNNITTGSGCLFNTNECRNRGLGHEGSSTANGNQLAAGNGEKENSKRGNGHRRDNDGFEENSRSCKQMAGFADDSEPLEKYDKSLLCPQMNPNFYRPPKDHGSDTSDEEEESNKQFRKSTEPKRGRPKGSTKKGNKAKEVVDLRGLLTRCAQAVASFNNTAAQDLLKQIRQHSSPFGDPNERLAHCFANALEARLSGTGSMMYTALSSRRISAAEILTSYQTYVTTCPFKRMSNILANKTIAKCTLQAPKIHIIDFGILYGFQWPCLIHGVSLRPGNPPILKITGIDFPQKGFKPAENVEQTGDRLRHVCKRFNVPFEYNAIAKKWDEITLDDLKIEKDEKVVVNCIYRLRHVPDESGPSSINSPRNDVLKLIKKIKPELFVHGVLNGTYNAPFFTSRFREALHHYSSFFDIMEATIPKEDQDRLLYEREVFGRDVLNIIACEGAERIERPESYKQWQVRNQRAGFTQLPMSPEILKEVKVKVFKGYHKEFMVEVDGDWMLQGWKGRVMYGLSFWKPNEE